MTAAIRKTRALIWEEIRVGGAVVSLLTVLGVLGILVYYFGDQQWYFEREPLMRYTYVVGPCLAAAVLLILNPNYSGHLGGGFSERILRLPVATRTAVTVSFLCRTFFVAASSTILIGLYNAVAEPPVAWSMIAIVTTAYTVFQFIDWGQLGKPLYVGVSLVLALIILVIAWYSFDNADRIYIAAVLSDVQNIGWLSLALIPAMYIGSRIVVNRTRSGRELIRLAITLPEFDEFAPKRSVFASPVAAQVWLQRRRGLSLVVWMLVPWSIIAVAANVYLDAWRPLLQGGNIPTSFIWIVSQAGYISLLVLAAYYGARTRIIGIRPDTGHAGYDFLLPCSVSDLASARVIANARALFPALIVAIAGHIVFGSDILFTQAVPEAFEKGYISIRETAWLVVGKALFIGIAAWVLMSIGTQLVRGVAAAIPLIFIVIEFVSLDVRFSYSHMSLAACAVVAAALVWAMVRATWLRLVTRSRVALWSAAWALATVLIYTQCGGLSEALSWKASAFVVSLGMGACVPLPFFGILIDIARRRHGSIRQQAPGTAPGLRWRAHHFACAGLVMALAMWLAWPGGSSFERFLNDRGYPKTLDALNTWYADVPESENVALNYMDFHIRSSAATNSFVTKQVEDVEPAWKRTAEAGAIADLLANTLNDPAKNAQAAPELSKDYWDTTVRPLCNEIRAWDDEAGDARLSKYPVDMNDGFAAELPYLADARNLARLLCFDAYYLMQHGETESAIANTEAIFNIADSFAGEPFIISQLVRIAILRVGFDTIADIQRDPSLDRETLTRLRDVLQKSTPAHFEEGEFIDRGMIGELIIRDGYLVYWDNELNNPALCTPVLAMQSLLVPKVGDRMYALLANDYARQARPMRYQSRHSEIVRSFELDHQQSMMFASPINQAVFGGVNSAYQAEQTLRLKLNIVDCALAIRLYQLDIGRLPNTLQALVPEYIEAVPDDYYSLGPLKYFQRKNGSVVVYSVGRNGSDELGPTGPKGPGQYPDDINVVIYPLPEADTN